MDSLQDMMSPAEHAAFWEMMEATPRIATALERIVEMMEGVEPAIQPDVVVDADGKLMHVTANAKDADGGGMFSMGGYFTAHDPDSATRAAKKHWEEQGWTEITNVKASGDD